MGGSSVLTKSGKKQGIHLELQRVATLARSSVPVIPNPEMTALQKTKTPELFSVEGPILRYCLLLLVIPNPAHEV